MTAIDLYAEAFVLGAVNLTEDLDIGSRLCCRAPVTDILQFVAVIAKLTLWQKTLKINHKGLPIN